MCQLTMTQKYLIAGVSVLTPELINVLREENDYEGLIDDACRLASDLYLLYSIIKSTDMPMHIAFEYFNLENYLKDWR